ncbi:hypothetical protein JCM17478_08110 [Thermopirellula anaerolimosa]
MPMTVTEATTRAVERSEKNAPSRTRQKAEGSHRIMDWSDGADAGPVGLERRGCFPLCDPNPSQSVLTHGRTH